MLSYCLCHLVTLRFVWFSMLSQVICHLVPLPLSTVLYVVTVPMSLGPTSIMHGSLCCPIVYVTWSPFRYVWFSVLSDCLCRLVTPPLCMVLYVVTVSMSLGPTSVKYSTLCCHSSYVTWSHFRFVWFSMLSDCLCHLVSLPLCMVLYFFRVSILVLFYLYVRHCVTYYGRSLHF